MWRRNIYISRWDLYKYNFARRITGGGKKTYDKLKTKSLVLIVLDFLSKYVIIYM